MKILYVINDLRSGGAEKLLEMTLPIMNKVKGLEVELLLLENKNSVYHKKILDNNIEISISKIKGMKNPLNIFYLKKFINQGNFDVVHVHLFPSNYWVSVVARLMRKKKMKFYLTEHSTHNRRREIKFLKYIEKVIYNSFDKIFSISSETQKNLIKWLEPNNIKKFEIIENGIEISKFSDSMPADLELFIPNYNKKVDKIICMTGSFTPQKDQITIIKALKYLPNNVKLVLIGEGKLLEKHIELVRNMCLEERVYFLGFRDDVEKILKASDIIVLSSRWEGFGLAAVEGMASGKPVIGSNVNGLSSVIDNSDLLFSVGNSKELSDILNKLLNDKKFYIEKSLECRKKASKYDINKMILKYLDSY